MKTIFTTLILISGFVLSAQNWCPRGAAWHFADSHGQTAGYQYWHNDADTIVNGINCRIVRGTQYLTTTGLPDTSVTQLGPVYTYNSNDTVYLFDTAFYPAYYFNAHAGDTIYTRNMGSANLSVVDSNGSMVFNGDTLRYYIFHLIDTCTTNPAGLFKVIERIGCTTTSLVPTWTCDTLATYHYSLCNYKDSLFATFPDSTTNCTSLPIVLPLVYHHLLDTVNIWHITGNGCAVLLPEGGSPRSQSCFGNWQPPSVCYTGEDTVIDSVHYLVVYTGSPYTCLAGFIREDTVQGKVYFRDNSSNPEWLLYDFSMQVGDSVYLSFQDQNSSPYSGFWQLNSISVVNTPAGPRHAFYLTGNGATITWLEGVGSPVFPLYLYYPPIFECGFFVGCNQPYGLIGHDNGIGVLTCYSHNSLVYFDSCAYESVVNLPGGSCNRTLIDSCDYSVICGGILSLSNLSSLNISPNPTSNQVTIQLNVAETANFDVYVKDLEGKTVNNHLHLGQLNSGPHSVDMDLSNLSPGFYLVECRTEAGSLYTKLVVQK